MHRFRAVAGLLLILGCLSPRAAGATPLLLDNMWIELNDHGPVNGPSGAWFTGTGLLSAGASGATSYTWTSSSQVKFDITDWYVVGDAYRVFDNGLLAGVFVGGPDYTSLAGCNGPFSAACHWTSDPNVAWLDPVFNHGSLVFAPGSHSLTIQSAYIPTDFPDGTVAFRATEVTAAPVPEPASLLLLGTGLTVAAARCRRKRARAPRLV